MLYGSELWGLNNVACIENVHIYACKRFLNVHTMSYNDAIPGDLGRYPMYIFAAKRCLKYRLRLLNMPGYRYVKLCLEAFLCNKLNYSKTPLFRPPLCQRKNSLYIGVVLLLS